MTGLLEAALKKRGRLAPNLTTWYFKVAAGCGCSASAVEKWTDGETECSLGSFRALCAFFGPDFRDEVLGDAKPLAPGQHADAAVYHIAELRRAADGTGGS